MLGSDAQLFPPTGETAQVQIQIDPLQPSISKLLCLAGQVSVARNGKTEQIGLYQFAPLQPFDQILIAGHTISIELPAPSAQSNNFAAELSIPEPTIQIGKALVGRLTVKNLGEKDNCQFQVTLSGLPKDCYQVESIPLMYPDSEAEVSIRFFHHGTYPRIGLAPIQLRIASDLSYPGEEIVIEKTLWVAPVFAYDLELKDDFEKSPPIVTGSTEMDEAHNMNAGEFDEASEDVFEAVIRPIHQEEPQSIVEELVLEDPIEPESDVQPEGFKEVKPISNPPTKVISNANPDFWNEDEL